MASRSINKAILLGHLGKDAETKFTPSGTAQHQLHASHQPPVERPANGRLEGRNGVAQCGALALREPGELPVEG